MKHHIIIRIAVKALTPLIILFAFYVQFHGDYGPGGGFQAGVILASSLILYGLIYGLDSGRAVISEPVVRACLSAGVMIYAGVGIAAMLMGGDYLDYGALNTHDPAHGHHLGIMLVEAGVGTTVTAAMLSIFYAFADRARVAVAERDDALEEEDV